MDKREEIEARCSQLRRHIGTSPPPQSSVRQQAQKAANTLQRAAQLAQTVAAVRHSPVSRAIIGALPAGKKKRIAAAVLLTAWQLAKRKK